MTPPSLIYLSFHGVKRTLVRNEPVTTSSLPRGPQILLSTIDSRGSRNTRGLWLSSSYCAALILSQGECLAYLANPPWGADSKASEQLLLLTLTLLGCVSVSQRIFLLSPLWSLTTVLPQVRMLFHKGS